MRLVVNPFVRRQTAESRFGHTNLSEHDLVYRVAMAFNTASRGYRDGVCLVPVAPDGFFNGTVVLKPGMPLRASYEARRDGEDPRLHVGADPGPHGYEAAKQPAVAADVVLYASTVLAEDGSNTLPPEPGN